MTSFTFSGVQRQLAAGLIASTTSFITGTVFGWAAPSLKKLNAPDSPIPLKPYEDAWIVNAIFIATIVSPLVSAALMNSLGRKTLVLILSLLPTLSWGIIYFSHTGSMLIAARALAGLWAGGCQTVIPIYVAEIAEPKVRGVVSTLNMVNTFAGTIFAFVIAPYVSIPIMAIICGVVPLMFFVLFSLLPESPYYYVMQERYEAAVESLTWFRGGAPLETIKKELTAIQTERETQEKKDHFRRMMNFITVPANRKAFVIVQIVTCLQRLSGLSSLTSFSTVILPNLGSVTPDHCTLIMGITWLVASLGCSALVDRVGRKPLLYVSGVGIFISMIPTGIWYYLDRETALDVSAFNWVPFAGFLVHATTFSLGLGPIAPSLQGEMFPSNLKSQASALATMNAAGSSAISVALFAVLNIHVGLYVNFFIFSAMGLVIVVFTYIYVIETKGKSLQMIQAELRGDKTKDIQLRIEQDTLDNEKLIKPKSNGGV